MKVKEASGLFYSELKDKYPDTEIGNFVYFTLQSVLGYSRTDIVLRKEEEIENKKLAIIIGDLDMLKKNIPIQYILGETEFYGLKFKVTPDVLIPRPETEELVDLIIKESTKANACIIDIGTGSGCIAISLKKHYPGSSTYAIDISEKALAIAKENAQINDADITFIKYDILGNDETNILHRFDIIVSNPPYVLESEKQGIRENVKDHEPKIALFVPDDDPFLFYHAIVKFAKKHLKPGGLIYFEINERLACELETSIKQYGAKDFTLYKDIHNKDRIMKCMLVV
jgi:release factor glutamine methyltransferase